MLPEQRIQVNDWIERIKEELLALYFHHQIFWQVQDIIKRNQRLCASSGYFPQWMGNAYVYSSAMYVRRQVDDTRHTLSFLRLLKLLSNNPTWISRDYFLSLAPFQNTALAGTPAGMAYREQANSIFNELVGSDKQHLERAIIETDIGSLTEKTASFQEYANTYVAHYSKREMASEKPTFQDLDKWIRFMIDLLGKYYMLITGNTLGDFHPEKNFDPVWKEVFTYAWIEPEAAASKTSD